MCKAASLIITKDQVLFSEHQNSHSIILQENNIKDTNLTPTFVKVEIIPPRIRGVLDYNAPFSKWTYTVDQDKVPNWYVPKVDEKRARKLLPKWHKSHIESMITDAEEVHFVGGDGSTLTGGNDSTLTGGKYSTLTGGNESTLTGGNESTLTGGYGSTLTGGDRSTLTGGDRSTLTGGNDSTLTGGNDSTLTGGNDSTLTGGYGSTLTGGVNSVLITHYYQAGWKVATKVITESDANKAYKFSDGKWTRIQG